MFDSIRTCLPWGKNSWIPLDLLKLPFIVWPQSSPVSFHPRFGYLRRDIYPQASRS